MPARLAAVLGREIGTGEGLHLICGDVSTGSIPAFAPSLPFELRLGKCRRRCNSTRRMLFRELKNVPRPSSALSANLLAALLRPLSARAEGRLGVPMPDVAGCTSACGGIACPGGAPIPCAGLLEALPQSALRPRSGRTSSAANAPAAKRDGQRHRAFPRKRSSPSTAAEPPLGSVYHEKPFLRLP